MPAASFLARVPWQNLIAVTAIVAVIGLVFANALGVAFVFDDLGDIVDNPSAHAATFFDRLPFTNRPLTKASYALNDALHGAAAAGYAAVNVTLHAVAALLALVLLCRAFAAARMPAALTLALAVCLLWALHPALTESVTYLSGRSMVLSAALMLAAVVASTGRRPHPVAAFICALLAPLARETALVLPFILLWWSLTVGHAPRRQWPVWLGALLAAMIVAAMPRHRDLVAFSLDLRDPVTALRGNLLAAAETLGFWFAPWRVTILPDAPPPYGWLEGPTLAALAGFATAALASVFLRRRAPVFAFGLGLTLLALAPAQSVLWRADPVALKPLYLAGLGLTLAAIDLIRRAVGARGVLIVACVVAIPLGVLTHDRNVLFRSEVALFHDAVEKAPENGKAWIAYGGALMGAKRYEDAERALRRGLELRPFDERAMNLLELLATIRSVERRHAPP